MAYLGASTVVDVDAAEVIRVLISRPSKPRTASSAPSETLMSPALAETFEATVRRTGSETSPARAALRTLHAKVRIGLAIMALSTCKRGREGACGSRREYLGSSTDNALAKVYRPR